MSTQVDTGAAVSGSLKDASLDRLVCLQRHWMWADEAMARFDRELADGVDYDDDGLLNADQHFGDLAFSPEILLSSEHSSIERLAAVGPGGRVVGPHRDNRGDSDLRRTVV